MSKKKIDMTAALSKSSLKSQKLPGFDDIVSDTRVEGVSDTPTPVKPKVSKKKESRYTIIIDNERLEKVRKIGYWKRIPIKKVFDEALMLYEKEYIKEHGCIEEIET
jgi:hypothetical protein